jgi:hypothetical protein
VPADVVANLVEIAMVGIAFRLSARRNADAATASHSR